MITLSLIVGFSSIDGNSKYLPVTGSTKCFSFFVLTTIGKPAEVAIRNMHICKGTSDFEVKFSIYYLPTKIC